MTEEQVLELINTNENFSAGSIPDKKFTINDLNESGYLYLEDVMPGSFVVIDATGTIANIPQIEKLNSQSICVGTYADLSNSGIASGEIWKIRFARGQRGEQGTGTQSVDGVEASQETIMYALLFN